MTSLYDGATAMAEAAMMACGITGRSEVLVSRTVHPHWRDVLATYARDRGMKILTVDYLDGVSNLAEPLRASYRQHGCRYLSDAEFSVVWKICRVMAKSRKNRARC